MATGVELNEMTDITISTPWQQPWLCQLPDVTLQIFCRTGEKNLLSLTLQSFSSEQLTNLVLSPHFPS